MSGECYAVEGRQFLVSAPLTEMIEMMSPEPPARSWQHAVRCAIAITSGSTSSSRNVRFRTNGSMSTRRKCAWRALRITPTSLPRWPPGPGLNPLTIEYFCFRGDDFWDARDYALIEHAKRELAHMKILQPDQVISGFVVRSDKAYPVIEIGYEDHIATIKRWLDQFQNLLPIGRSGMFKYNNQDHAMATGLLAARTAPSASRNTIPGWFMSMLVSRSCARAAQPHTAEKGD